MKAAEKVAEKVRRQSLTPAEAKAEAVERKAECARKKAARILQSDERFREALAVASGQHVAEEDDMMNEDDVDMEDVEI